jgi:hypothetical protein
MTENAEEKQPNLSISDFQTMVQMECLSDHQIKSLNFSAIFALSNSELTDSEMVHHINVRKCP